MLFTLIQRVVLGLGTVVVGLYSLTNIAAILTEDLAINQNDTSPVCISLGSGGVLCPTITPFSASGSANKGYVARIQSPQVFTSGALLTSFTTQCGRKADVQLADVGISKFNKASASGTRVMYRNVSLGTGTTFFSGSGTKVIDGDYLVVLTATGASYKNAGDCVLKANWAELYTASH